MKKSGAVTHEGTSAHVVNGLNIFLILLSLALAFAIPFELFLFSYAVLGPAHYLTEINWLNGKDYFVRQKRWVWILAVASVLAVVPYVLQLPQLEPLRASLTPVGRQLARGMTPWLMLFALLFSVGLVYFEKIAPLAIFLTGSAVLSLLIVTYVPLSLIIAGIFLPTIIHVYLFTLLFMVFGNLKSKSALGTVAIVLLILCPLIIFSSQIDPGRYVVSERTQQSYEAGDFQLVGSALARLFVLQPDQPFELLSSLGIQIQILIAFSYTYHYLNWFSKTSLIGWNRNLSKLRLSIMFLIWLCTVLLYFYNYKAGFTVLLFLSLLHVLLEFPLNVTSIRGIVGHWWPAAPVSAARGRSQGRATRPRP